MLAEDNILELLKQKGAEAARKTQQAVILQPGAIGDCILTLPLAAFMKKTLRLGGIDIIGHTDYVGILPGRTCIDCARSIDSIELHKLFVKHQEFDLKDADPLISAFADYAWIATFLGEPNSNFEQNLIFTANCSHSTEIITLNMKPPEDFSGHFSDFCIGQLTEQIDLPSESWKIESDENLIKATRADINTGNELLREIGIDKQKKIAVVQPGSGGKNKCWHIENFLAVADELASKDFETIFLLGPAEIKRFSDETVKHIISVATCLRDLPLSQVLGLLSRTDVFIGNDSGISHLAAGLGIRTFVIYGPTKPAVYKPIGPAVTVLTDKSATFATHPSSNIQRELLDILAE